MKVQKAIKNINALNAVCWQKDFYDEEFARALALAIQSLEMQIPKKPIYSDFDDNGNDEIIPYKAVCPVCGCEFEFGTWNDEENHHCKCGQKIDWEGDRNE